MRHISVCVTGQKNCERLIREGAELAKANGAELSVVHVARRGAELLGNPDEGKALEYLFQTSDSYGADMTVLRSDNVADTLTQYARKNNVDMFVLGMAGRPQKWDLSRELQMMMPSIIIHTVLD